MEPHTSSFVKLLLQSLDEGLARVLGEDTAKAMKFYIDPSIAAGNPDLFMTSVHKIFGKGARTIESRILHSLYSRVGLRLNEEGDRAFWEYVEEAKRAYIQKIVAQQPLVS